MMAVKGLGGRRPETCVWRGADTWGQDGRAVGASRGAEVGRRLGVSRERVRRRTGEPKYGCPQAWVAWAVSGFGAGRRWLAGPKLTDKVETRAGEEQIDERQVRPRVPQHSDASSDEGMSGGRPAT